MYKVSPDQFGEDGLFFVQDHGEFLPRRIQVKIGTNGFSPKELKELEVGFEKWSATPASTSQSIQSSTSSSTSSPTTLTPSSSSSSLSPSASSSPLTSPSVQDLKTKLENATYIKFGPPKNYLVTTRPLTKEQKSQLETKGIIIWDADFLIKMKVWPQSLQVCGYPYCQVKERATLEK